YRQRIANLPQLVCPLSRSQGGPCGERLVGCLDYHINIIGCTKGDGGPGLSSCRVNTFHRLSRRSWNRFAVNNIMKLLQVFCHFHYPCTAFSAFRLLLVSVQPSADASRSL